MEEDKQPERLEMKGSETTLSFCPSFNSYSSHQFVEIADRVADECSRDAELTTDERSRDEEEKEDDFEFSLVRGDPDADEISFDGEFRRIFPIFNRDILIHDHKPDVATMRIPLKKLFSEDRDEVDPPTSSSSEEADELERVPVGTYCVWRPNAVEASPSRCKKSSSTGSASKRWNLRDLLGRSNSDGKGSFVFLTQKNKEVKEQKAVKIEEKPNSRGKVKAKGEKVAPPSRSSAHEVFYVRNRASKEVDKRKSYLPYRQDLVGFFASVNGAGKAFPPF